MTREGQTFDGGSRLVQYANLVKLPHMLASPVKFAGPIAVR